MPKIERPAPLAGGHGAKVFEHPENTDLRAELQALARDVRAIGYHRTDPESIAIAKDHVATRLRALARVVGGAQ